MPEDESIEELLAKFEGSDESPDEGTTAPSGSGMKQLRDAYKKQAREAAKAQKERDEALAQVGVYQRQERLGTLQNAGLTEKQATAYERIYGSEISSENLVSFKTDILGQSISDEEKPDAPFAPTTGGDSGPSSVTKAEFEAIMRVDQAKGWALLNSGKVQF